MVRSVTDGDTLSFRHYFRFHKYLYPKTSIDKQHFELEVLVKNIIYLVLILSFRLLNFFNEIPLADPNFYIFWGNSFLPIYLQKSRQYARGGDLSNGNVQSLCFAKEYSFLLISLTLSPRMCTFNTP